MGIYCPCLNIGYQMRKIFYFKNLQNTLDYSEIMYYIVKNESFSPTRYTRGRLNSNHYLGGLIF